MNFKSALHEEQVGTSSYILVVLYRHYLCKPHTFSFVHPIIHTFGNEASHTPHILVNKIHIFSFSHLHCRLVHGYVQCHFQSYSGFSHLQRSPATHFSFLQCQVCQLVQQVCSYSFPFIYIFSLSFSVVCIFSVFFIVLHVFSHLFFFSYISLFSVSP